MSDPSKEVKKTEELLKDRIQVVEIMAKMLKMQARRILASKEMYELDKSQGKGQVFDSLYSASKNQQYEQYSKLISIQFSKAIEKCKQLYDAIKLKLSKLSAEIKAGKANKPIQKIQQLHTEQQSITAQLQETWNRHTYLMCNYRMQITARQIQRWSLVLSSQQTPQKSEESVRTSIDNLFK